MIIAAKIRITTRNNLEHRRSTMDLEGKKDFGQHLGGSAHYTI